MQPWQPHGGDALNASPDNAQHWQNVYTGKAPEAVSWFQPHAQRSVELILATDVPSSAAIIDVGSGASRLIDDLLAVGFTDITALDISAAALAAARARLGEAANSVQWLVADVTQADLPPATFDVWHDRAVFHFLTEPAQRRAYLNVVLHALKPGGYLVMSTFAEDGPLQCSGLPVCRYSAAALQAEFGPTFTWLRTEREVHATPMGTEQKFVYCLGRRTHD